MHASRTLPAWRAYRSLLTTRLRNLSAVSTNLTLMAVPVVGVVSSAIILGEDVTTSLLLGLVLVILGVAVNLLSDRTTKAEPADVLDPQEVV